MKKTTLYLPDELKNRVAEFQYRHSLTMKDAIIKLLELGFANEPAKVLKPYKGDYK